MLPEGSNLGNGRKIAITVYKERIVLMREFRDAAVDRAPDGMSAAPQVEVDASGATPSVRCRLEVVLMLQVLYEQSPFILVPGPLQQLQLVEASEHHLVV